MRPEDICHHYAYWQKWLQYSTTKDHFWGRTALLTKFYAINPSQCLVLCKALNFLFCLRVEFISSYCGLGKPWPIVQLRYCLQGESNISSQGTSSICGCIPRTTKGPIRTEGIQKSEQEAVGKWTAGGWSQRLWLRFYVSEYQEPAECTLSQTPFLSPTHSILKARGRYTFCLEMQQQPNHHPRLQLSGMWHAYRRTQPETNLTILMSCKSFSQEDMCVYPLAGKCPY